MVKRDLNKPRWNIESTLMALIDTERMVIKSSKINKLNIICECVTSTEPRDRNSAHIFPEMEVFFMVQNAKNDNHYKVTRIMMKLAIRLCKEEGLDRS